MKGRRESIQEDKGGEIKRENVGRGMMEDFPSLFHVIRKWFSVRRRIYSGQRKTKSVVFFLSPCGKNSFTPSLDSRSDISQKSFG